MSAENSFSLKTEPSRGWWHCCYQHLIASRPTLDLKQNVCRNSPMSGLLSATLIFMTQRSPLPKPLKMECSYQSGRKHCTCTYKSMDRFGEMVACATFSPSTCTYNSMYRCGEMVARATFSPSTCTYKSMDRCGEMVARATFSPSTTNHPHNAQPTRQT